MASFNASSLKNRSHQHMQLQNKIDGIYQLGNDTGKISQPNVINTTYQITPLYAVLEKSRK